MSRPDVPHPQRRRARRGAASPRSPEQQARSSAGPSEAPPPSAGLPEDSLPEDGPDVIDAERSYRQGPVYGSAVPTAVLSAVGFVTHMDTLRLETSALGLMAYLQAMANQHHQLRRRQQAGHLQASRQLQDPQLPLFDTSFSADVFSADASSPESARQYISAYQYVNAYSGREHVVERQLGTFIKSIQGIAEDLYRRIYKRLPPAQDPLADPDFRKIYERVLRALQRVSSPAAIAGAEGDTLPRETAPAAPIPSKRPTPKRPPREERSGPLLQRLGPAVPSPNKLVRDRNGQRWRASRALRSAPPEKAAQTTRAVRASGPAPRIPWHRPYLDPLQVTEALYAHREALHERFTHGWKATIQDGQWTRHQLRHARRSETSIATQGSDRPSFISVGRWREDEITRRHPDSAVTVPWIIADIDGEDPATSAKHAKTLCRLLVKCGLDPSHLVVSYTGGRGCHVRIPHGAVGCPIYQDVDAASVLLSRFFDTLCTDHPRLRAAIDDAACRPTQMIRMIGSDRTHGGRCVAVTGDTFLELHPLVLFGHSDNSRYDGFTLPKPEEAPYTPGLGYLLLPEDLTTKHHPIHRPVTQLLQGWTSPNRLQLRIDTNAQKKGRGGSAIHVNQYCWKPHFSRPPPTGDSQLHQPGNGPSEVIGRLMNPVQEGEAWGEAVERSYVGRNKACFIMGLYAYTYPGAALLRVQTLLTERDGEPMPGGDGAAPTGGQSSRWMQQISQARAAGHERADAPVGDAPVGDVPTGAVPASDVPVEAIVHAWNRLVCRPALPEREVDTTLRSARSYT
ncbi:hypothetical protein CRI93_14845 [Longimonas halophila]|uniref:DNA primase n=1 Tax=Longimonas halophila TaxID=1469170 RepID=A0A2H3NKJ0_9BACT|nr:hypothetical protein [Longimonas halophila]PEN04634.1 hypothetical protein CRI93_14845 [Longimonas halophila]